MNRDKGWRWLSRGLTRAASARACSPPAAAQRLCYGPAGARRERPTVGRPPWGPRPAPAPCPTGPCLQQVHPLSGRRQCGHAGGGQARSRTAGRAGARGRAPPPARAAQGPASASRGRCGRRGGRGECRRVMAPARHLCRQAEGRTEPCCGAGGASLTALRPWSLCSSGRPITW